MDANEFSDALGDVVADCLPEDDAVFKRSGRLAIQQLLSGDAGGIDGGSRSGVGLVMVPDFIKLAIAVLELVKWWVTNNKAKGGEDAALLEAETRLVRDLVKSGVKADVAKRIGSRHTRRFVRLKA